MIVEIIKENLEYQYSSYKVGEKYKISFEFDKYYLGTYADKQGHATGILKTDCKIIDGTSNKADSNT